jgi:hypothetical protein
VRSEGSGALPLNGVPAGKKETTDKGAVIFVSKASDKILTTKLSRATEKKLEKAFCLCFKCLFRKKTRD